MAAVNGVGAVTGMVYAFVNQLYDIRDQNQDGKVTALEDYFYTSRHHKVVFAVPAVSPGTATASADSVPANGGGITVAPVFNVMV